MAKIPTAADFSRQAPSVSRPIVGYQSGQAERAAQDLSKTLGGVASMLEQEQKKLDDIRVEDAINKAKMSALELSQGEEGFTKVKGEGVVTKPVRDDYTKRFSQKMGEIGAGLSQSQKSIFNRRSQPLSLSYQSSLLGHIGRETSNYQDTTDLATMDIEVQEAAANWGNPQTVIESAQRIKYTVNSIADRKGLSADAKKKLLNENMTQMHKGVIYSMLESTPKQAKIYYSKNKKDINGINRIAIETKLKAGTVKLESQSLTDEVIGRDLTYAASLAEIRKKSGDNADLREESITLFKQRNNELDGAIKEATYDAGIHIAENGTLEGLPQETIDLIPAGKRNAMEKVAREQRQGVEPIQDHKEWADFNKTVGLAYSGDQKAIKTLKDMDVYGQLRMKLDDSHYDQALAAQRSFVTNDAKAKSRAGSMAGQVLTNKAAADRLINDLLGVKKSSKRNEKGQRFADRFYTLAQAEIDQWGIDNPKKKIPPVERDKIYRDLAGTLMVEDAGFMWFDKELDIADIPEKYLNEIADDLRKDGMPITGKNLIGAYLAAKEKGLLE
jgi:hypothetical protein